MTMPVTLCLLDSGILPGSVAAAQIWGGINLTSDGVDSDLFSHENDHGTAVAETALAACPGARLAVIRVIDERGWLCTTEAVETAFAWVLDHLPAIGPAVICAAFGDMFHYRSDASFVASPLQTAIATLRAQGVLTVTAAGNMYPRFRIAQAQGMAWPAILRETVSVGALETEADMADATAIHPALLSQRLHTSFGSGCATTLFATPGPPGESSGAAARVAGLLAQKRLVAPQAAADDLLAALLARTQPMHDALTGLTWPALSG